jgi:hypothetical protein
MKGNQYVLNFIGTKIFDKKTFTIVPEDEEITISKVNEKMIVPLLRQNVNF